MVEISIICLIYKSSKLAEAVYESINKYTPKLKNGEADFLFVANDPTLELVEFLELNDYPYLINVNEHLSDEELFKQGYGSPEYIRRVYQGYNQGILHAKGQKIVLINSDNFFSEDWLENLLKYSDYKTVVSSTLVEPGHDKFGVFPGAIHKNLGKTTSDYDDVGFQEFASKIAKTGYTSGGAYMPCLLYRDVAIIAGLYPEGNIAGKSFDQIKIFGDEYFYEKLKSFGVQHITAKDSIVYHLKEGEKSESSIEQSTVADKKYCYPGLGVKHTVAPTNLINYIKPEANHTEIMEALGKKYTAIITHFWSYEELQSQVAQVLNQSVSNVEIIVLYSENQIIGNKIEGVEYLYATNEMKGAVLFNLLHRIYGEYLLVCNMGGIYENDLLSKLNEKDVIYHIGAEVETNDKVIEDSVGNFVIPTGILRRNISEFIGPILYNGNIKINFKKQKVLTIPYFQIEEEVLDVPKYKQTLPYKAFRKIYREGPRSAASSAAHRIRRKA